MSSFSPSEDASSAQRDMPGAFPTAQRQLLPLPVTHSPLHPGDASVKSDATALTISSLAQLSINKVKKSKKKKKIRSITSADASSTRLLEAARGIASRVPSWRKPGAENGGLSVSPGVSQRPLQMNPITAPPTSQSTSPSPIEHLQTVPGICITPATPKKANHGATSSQTYMPAIHPPNYPGVLPRACTPSRAARVAHPVASPRSARSSVQSPVCCQDQAQTSWSSERSATLAAVSFEDSGDPQTSSPQTIRIPTPVRPINIAQLSSINSANDGSAEQYSSLDLPPESIASSINLTGTPNGNNVTPNLPPSPQPSLLDPDLNISPSPPKSTSQEEGSGWPNVAEKFGEHDGKKVREWHDELDTLLVFAGLFSAIVTAFIIEFYSALLPDSDGRREKQMTRLSEQMEQLTIYLVSQDPSQIKIYPPVHFEKFVPPISAVWMNSLWFSSLLCALMAAALATLTKQWLRRYIAVDYSASRERVRLREHRYSSLVLWIVPQAIASLPVLLRIALNLFFAGLLVQLWQLDTALTSVCVIWVALWTAVYTLATILPSAFPRCPYASPEALAFAHLVRAIRRGVKGRKSFSWDEREESCKQDPSLDMRALATAAVTFSDTFLENPVRECVRDLQPHVVPLFIAECFRHRLQNYVKGRIIWGVKSNAQLHFSKFSRQATAAFVNMLLDATERSLKGVSSEAGFHLLAISQCLGDLLRYNSWQLPNDIEERLRHFFRHTLEALQPNLRHAAALTENITSTLCARPEFLEPGMSSILPQLMQSAAPSFKARAPVEHSLEACIVVLTLQDVSDIHSREMDQFVAIHTGRIRDAALRLNIDKMSPMDRTTCTTLLNRCSEMISRLPPFSGSKGLRIALSALRSAIAAAVQSTGKPSKRSSKIL